jgi:hypothetical protein
MCLRFRERSVVALSMRVAAERDIYVLAASCAKVDYEALRAHAPRLRIANFLAL